MHMDVDKARRDHLAFCVDDFRSFRLFASDKSDFPVLDADIGIFHLLLIKIRI